MDAIDKLNIFKFIKNLLKKTEIILNSTLYGEFSFGIVLKFISFILKYVQ
jgi:hypothetical protein